jgi:peptide/nickel transport system permease protein
VIVLLYVPIVTRVIRSATLNIRNSGFIEAARLRGESTLYILFREILPSVLPALTVEVALRFSYAIFLTTSLGFLGLGVQPPSPDWGRMVNEAREGYARTPWALWYPVGAIATLVVGVNLLADGLRRVFRYEGQI